MKAGYMKVTNYTEAASAPGTWAKTTISGKGDPGYSLTAGPYFPEAPCPPSVYLTSALPVTL